MGSRRHTARPKPSYRDRGSTGLPLAIGKCAVTGKWQYDNRREARAAAKALRVVLKDPDLTHYLCSECDYHHVGHAFGLTREEHRQLHAAKEDQDA